MLVSSTNNTRLARSMQATGQCIWQEVEVGQRRSWQSSSKRAWVRQKETSENNLVKYYQQFQVMSAALKADNKLTDNEINRYFWFGIHQDDRRTILSRLENQDRTFDRKTVPTVQKAVEAGQVVFCDEAMDLGWDDPIAEIVSKDTKRRTSKGRKEATSSEEEEISDTEDESDEEEKRPKTKTVRQEVQTKVAVQNNLDDIEELAKKLRGLNVADVNYAGTYTRLVILSPAVVAAILSLPPQTTSISAATSALPIQPYPNNVPLPHNHYPRSQQWNDSPPVALPRDIQCHFCKENHLIRDCLHVPEYIRLLRIILIGRWFCYPDGHPNARCMIKADAAGGIKATINKEMSGFRETQPPPNGQ